VTEWAVANSYMICLKTGEVSAAALKNDSDGYDLSSLIL
jgi:hypothetical protein